MLLRSTYRNYCSLVTLLVVSFVLLVSWRLLPHEPLTDGFYKISPIWTGLKDSSISPLPQLYSQVPAKVNDCTERTGALFLQRASNASVNYCDDASSSTLTCFRTDASKKRTDSFCIGTPAVFDSGKTEYKLGCALTDLTEQQVAAGVPSLAQFPTYWYETGPGLILNRHVNLDPVEFVPTQDTTFPKYYDILVRREAPVDNLFHHFMQIFSIYMTLDVLQLTIDGRTGGPTFRAQDVHNTRVVVFDDHEDGPFYDQWQAFATTPTIRAKDLHPGLTSPMVNIIIPLPGSANPLWQDDWLPADCGEHNLLQLFSQRLLDFYGITDMPNSSDSPLTLTFIDRREKRSLVDKDAYVNHLKTLYPDIEITLVNFAALSFTEQLKLIRKTDILAGVHGAGLTHGIFLRPSSTMVEVLPHDFNYKGFRNIAKILGHQYFATHSTENANYSSRGWQYDDVFIEENRFDKLIDTAIMSMKHRDLA